MDLAQDCHKMKKLKHREKGSEVAGERRTFLNVDPVWQ